MSTPPGIPQGGDALKHDLPSLIKWCNAAITRGKSTEVVGSFFAEVFDNSLEFHVEDGHELAAEVERDKEGIAMQRRVVDPLSAKHRGNHSSASHTGDSGYEGSVNKNAAWDPDIQCEHSALLEMTRG